MQGQQDTFIVARRVAPAPSGPASKEQRSPRTTARRWARPLILALAAALLLAAVLLLLLGTRDAAWLKAALDRASPSGIATLYPIERCRDIIARAQQASAALALTAGALAFIPALTRSAARVLAGALVWASSLPRAAQRFLREEPWTFAVLVAITLLGAAARLWFLNMELRGDEADTLATFASKPLPQAIAEYTNPNNHVLNTLLTAIMARTLGTDAWALRLPVLLLGIALIPAIFALTRSLYKSPAAALAASAAAAFSPYIIYYAVSIRGYTHIMLAFTLGAILSARLIRRPASTATWAAWAAVGALGFWAIPTMLYAFSALCAWIGLHALLAWRGGRRAPLTRLTTGGLLAALFTLGLYLPILVVSGLDAITSNPYVQPMAAAEFSFALRERGGMFLSLTHAGLPWAATGALAICLIAALARHRTAARQQLPLILAVALSSVALLACTRAFPYARVWTFTLPLWCAMVGAGAVTLAALFARGRGVSILAAAAIALGLAVPLALRQMPRTIDEGSLFLGGADIAAYLKETRRPGDRLILTWPAAPSLNYHGQRIGIPGSYFNVLAGDQPFTHAVIDAPLEEFNRKLEYVGYPPVSAGGFVELRAFEHATVVRLDPPLPGTMARRRDP